MMSEIGSFKRLRMDIVAQRHYTIFAYAFTNRLP